MASAPAASSVPDDFSERVKSLRPKLSLPQAQLAERLGASFATVNRWENRQVKPSPHTWDRILRLDIEVKGRAGVGEIEVTANDWTNACNLREGYWLFVVYDCATPDPWLVRAQDPCASLLAKAKGSLVVSPERISEASQTSTC